MVKKFSEWLKLKEHLDNNSSEPLFSVGEIWWCNIGENVGTEINGKSSYFTRPVLIFIKFNKNTFFALPLTSKSKQGTWYTQILFKGVLRTVVLNQGRTLNVKRLWSRIGQADEMDFKKIKAGFSRLYL